MTNLWKDPETGERPAWVAYIITAAVALIVGGIFIAVTFVDHSSLHF